MSTFQIDKLDILFNLMQMNPNESMMEHKEIVLEFIKFCENAIDPTRMICDETGLSFDAKTGIVRTPECLKELQKTFYDNGWFALGVDEKFGGTELPQRLVSAVCSLAIGCNTAWYLYPALSKACMNVLIKKGTPKIHQDIVPLMIQGKWGGTMCLTESGAGSDVGSITTKASLKEGRLYNITGEKIFISSGQNDLYENIVHLVLAKAQGGNSGVKDLSLFMVLRNDNNVVCEKIEHKMGIHASATCVLRFENSVGELIGELGQGIANMFLMMNEARLLCALQGEGQSHMAYMKAFEYANERVQFGVPIATHGDVQRMLLTLRANTRGMRALCQYTSNILNEGNERIELLTPIAKAYCTDEGFQCCVTALQVFGGYGYCQEYGIEQFVRDSKIASIYEGTNGIQARDFLFRKIIKDKGQNITDLMKDIGLSLKRCKEMPIKKEEHNLAEGIAEIHYSLETLGQLLAQLSSKDVTVQELGFHAYPILCAFSHLVISWLLLEHASQAIQVLNSSKLTDFSNDYLETKVVDFNVYVGNYLTRNRGIVSSIQLGRKMRTYGIN